MAEAPMTALRYWLLAARPKTLPLSVTPVLAGNALAHAEGALLDGGILLATLLASMAIQIGTNLHNDAADFERGADTPERLGPPRAAAQGWFSVGQIKRAALAAFGFAFLIGIWLAVVGGWPIVAIGIAALLAGWGYTAGPRPIAYSASGELFVLLFFGLFAVAGSHYLQTGTSHLMPWLLGAAIGMPAAAVLLVNNYRDIDTDRAAGKLTLATRAGRPAMRRLYALLLLLPTLLPLPLALAGHYWAVPALLALPAALVLVRRLAAGQGQALNRQLAQTAGLQALYGLLVVVGLLVLPSAT